MIEARLRNIEQALPDANHLRTFITMEVGASMIDKLKLGETYRLLDIHEVEAKPYMPTDSEHIMLHQQLIRIETKLKIIDDNVAAVQTGLITFNQPRF